MNWYSIFITVIAILFGIAMFFIIKEQNKRKTEQLTLRLQELKLDKAKYILKEVGEVDYLTKYVALYEAGFIHKEIIEYIGTNT
jgi:hypothetical protein